MIEFTPALALVALVYAGINLLKNLTNKKWGSAATQLIVWIVGVFFTWLFSESDFGSGIPIGDTGTTFGNANFASLILVGMVVGAMAIGANDFKKAVDGSDSAATPKLFPEANNNP